jgi:hypothetical protein
MAKMSGHWFSYNKELVVTELIQCEVTKVS